MRKHTQVRLNLGSGTDYLQGWTNVDVHTDYHPDVLADLRKPFPWKDATVDEIQAHDLLEHFTLEGGEAFLKECRRVLKVGGILHLRLPCVDRIIKHFRHDPEVMLGYIYGNTKTTGEFGAHKAGYTQRSLRRLLCRSGFDQVDIIEDVTNFVVKAQAVEAIERPMHILLVQQSPGIGGAEMYMQSLVKQWKKSGHEVSVIGFGTGFLKMMKPLCAHVYEVPVHFDFSGNVRGLVKSCGLFPLIGLMYGAYAWRIHRLRKIDMILVSGLNDKVLATVLSNALRLPMVWIEYGSLMPVFSKLWHIPKIIYRLIKHAPEYVITPSHHAISSLKYDGRISESKIRHLACGVQIPSKVRHGGGGKRFTLGCVSRLTPEKGQDLLIRALPLIAKHIPSVRCVIVGEGPDAERLKKLVKKLSLEKVVEFPGFVEILDDWFTQFDVCVFPSMWEMEGFGLVLAEAMARSIPVVAFAHGPMVDIIGDAGVLVTKGSVKELSQAVVELYKNPAQRRAYGAAGREKAQKEYDIRKQAAHMLEIFKEACVM